MDAKAASSATVQTSSSKTDESSVVTASISKVVQQVSRATAALQQVTTTHQRVDRSPYLENLSKFAGATAATTVEAADLNDEYQQAAIPVTQFQETSRAISNAQSEASQTTERASGNSDKDDNSSSEMMVQTADFATDAHGNLSGSTYTIHGNKQK